MAMKEDISSKIKEHSSSSDYTLSNFKSINACIDIDCICFVYAQESNIDMEQKAEFDSVTKN